MLEHLRRSTVLSMLALFAFATVLGGKEMVHYAFMHQESEAHTDAHLQECCEPDHRLPHFHADQYCFLCDIDVSVVLHTEQYALAGTTYACIHLHTSDKAAVFQPALLTCHDLRGPPTA